MKKILLTQRKYALVDDDDYDELIKHHWYAKRNKRTWYAVRMAKLADGKHRQVFMHREIVGLSYGDVRMVDHLNHNGLDNRRANIRIVTAVENARNRSGSVGYYLRKDGSYEVSIAVEGRLVYLGRFKTGGEARKAYLEGKKRLHPSTPLPDK